MNDADTAELVLHLKRVEGQIKGIQKMMDEHRPCREVLTQIIAARSSLDNVGVQLFQREVGDCLQADGPHNGEQVRQLQETIKLWSKLS
jgi:CsoR family transcriptional regulator, copper-sensing transcriptional repressor